MKRKQMLTLQRTLLEARQVVLATLQAQGVVILV